MLTFSPSGHFLRKLAAGPWLLPAVLFVGLFSVATSASATTVINRSIPEMTAVSGLVISGRVAQVAPNQSAPGYPLATRVTIAVDRVFKGHRTAPTISFMIPGGVRDGKAMFIPGMPSFNVGEDVVVFLERTPHGWIPSSLKNGKFTVATDSYGRRVVWRDTDGLGRLATDASLTRSAAVESDAMTMDDLEGLIHDGLSLRVPARHEAPATDGGAE